MPAGVDRLLSIAYPFPLNCQIATTVVEGVRLLQCVGGAWARTVGIKEREISYIIEYGRVRPFNRCYVCEPT